MTAGIAFLLTTVVTLAISAIVLSREKFRTEAAHRVAVANEMEAKRQVTIAQSNEAEAKRQQQRAERSFDKVRAAADEYWLTRLVEDSRTLDVDRTGNGLKGLLDDALTFYQSLVDDTSDSSVRIHGQRPWH